MSVKPLLTVWKTKEKVESVILKVYDSRELTNVKLTNTIENSMNIREISSRKFSFQM